LAAVLTHPTLLSRYREPLEARLRILVDQRTGELAPFHRYHLGWEDQCGNPVSASGKALRPALCLLACEGLSGDCHPALPAACAIELIHNFSLVHDDIQDGDRQRRHRPTLWTLWGVPRALNAGDSLLALALTALLGSADEPGGEAPPETVGEAHRLLASACLAMIEGQYLDLAFEERAEVSLADYLDMVTRKTGALMACALEMGALFGGADHEARAACHQAGLDLGIAFQARDDARGVWGDVAATGKAVGGDVQRRKKSLPIVFGLTAEGPIAEELRRLYRKLWPAAVDDVARVPGLLTELGAADFARRLVQEHCDAASEHLRRAGLAPWALDEFEDLIAFLKADAW
jgi:geranylgeranyl diphosphate synthase type I